MVSVPLVVDLKEVTSAKKPRYERAGKKRDRRIVRQL